MEIITGERLQEMCDVYLGSAEDFSYNPRISHQREKCLPLSNIKDPWNNPRVIFCYGHALNDFSRIMSCIQNEFILVSHNSDQNITAEFSNILEHPKLLFWHAQNMLLQNPKLGGLPIGIANSMWGHGDVNAVHRAMNVSSKMNDFYFYFNIQTNPAERNKCKTVLEKRGLIFENPCVNFSAYTQHLATFKYAICPPGNGIDSHRIWEVLYLGVIPIVKRSVFTEALATQYLCIVLDNWDEFDAETLLKTYVQPTILVRPCNIREATRYM
jgi:hypothetical protein